MFWHSWVGAEVEHCPGILISHFHDNTAIFNESDGLKSNRKVGKVKGSLRLVYILDVTVVKLSFEKKFQLMLKLHVFSKNLLSFLPREAIIRVMFFSNQLPWQCSEENSSTKTTRSCTSRRPAQGSKRAMCFKYSGANYKLPDYQKIPEEVPLRLENNYF